MQMTTHGLCVVPVVPAGVIYSLDPIGMPHSTISLSLQFDAGNATLLDLSCTPDQNDRGAPT
ncbi:hypothetical protein WS65_05585 [Burkholderia anthina]|nr:hypothetical protein WS65_05585 [Burkholderia anthina]